MGEKTAASAANSILASAMDDALTVTDGGRSEWRRIQSSFLSPFLPRFAVFFHCLAVAAEATAERRQSGSSRAATLAGDHSYPYRVH